MFAWAASLLGRGLVAGLGNTILKPILAYLGTKADAQRDVDVARIGADQARDAALVAAEIQANDDRRAMASEFKPLVYLTALPFVLHSGAVMLDSTFAFGWRIAKAPEPFAGWEGQILLSFFVLSPATSIAKAITARMAR